MVEVMRRADAEDPSTLFVVGAYHIGKERAFLRTAKALGWRIWCSPAKLRVGHQLPCVLRNLCSAAAVEHLLLTRFRWYCWRNAQVGALVFEALSLLWLSGQVLRMLRLPGEEMALLTEDAAAARIHVCFMGADLQPEALQERMRKGGWKHIVGFKPTGQLPSFPPHLCPPQ